MQARRLIIGYIFYISLSLSVAYIYGFKSLQSIWAPLLGYSIISYFLHLLWSKIRKKTAMNFLGFFVLFLYKSAIYLSICIVIFSSFFYYQNYINPAKLPTHTLSNGEQTLIFQTMSHIGSQSFYSQVQRNITQAKHQNFVLYFEGVLPGSEKNSKAFNAALGIDFKPGLYDNFSRLYGVRAQDNNDFLELVNNLDYNIDLSLDEIMEIYNAKNIERLQSLPTENSNNKNQTILDLNSEVISKLSKISDKELAVLRYINQGILNFMIKHDGLRDVLISKLANQDIFSVILDDRNKHLAETILTKGDEKIIVLYGLMHFEGVLELLQSQDDNWEIISTQYNQIITQSS